MLDGKVAIVTGAGRGVGRAEALELASQGARVVVNDLGGSAAGDGADAGPAAAVVEEIRAAGGEATANTDDVSDFQGARRLVEQAVDSFGRLDILVNNAGILRDRMLVNMTEEEWDAVIRVHLKGTFGPTRWAAEHWRNRVKAGETVSGRVINTSSASGIYGNVGQANYGAAKAGIASFSIITSMELGRYGVTVNAIAPAAQTRLTEGLGPEPDADTARRLDPRWIAVLVTWLASDAAAGVTGRVFEASGVRFAVAEGWHRGPSADPVDDPAEVGAVVERLLAEAVGPAGMPGL